MMIVHGMLGVNHDFAIAMNMLGFNMIASGDYYLDMMNIMIASTTLIILTWLSYSSDYASDCDITVIVPWIILWILL